MRTITILCIAIVMMMVACETETHDVIKDNSTPVIEASVDIPVDDEIVTNIQVRQTYSKLELLEDYEQLYTLIERHHPKLFSDDEAIETQYLLNKESIKDDMDDLEFLRIITPMVSLLNCGHTHINVSETVQRADMTSSKYLPLEVKIFEDKLYVTDNILTDTIPIGAQVLSINQQSADAVLEVLMTMLSSDGQNETSKQGMINQNFRYFYYNYIEASHSFEVEYIDPSTQLIHAVSVDAKLNQEIYGEATWSPEDFVPYTSDFFDTYAILDMNAFYPFGSYTIEDYNTYIDDFFETIQSESIQQVILDLRDNGGGDPMITSHLFSYLEREPMAYFHESAPNYYAGLKSPIELADNHYEGELLVLMDGGSFSSTGHLLALLKHQGRGVFIGQESGGSYACSDSSRNYSLNNTNFVFRSATQIWQVDVDSVEHGRGILPDYEVTHTLESYLADEDLTLITALKLFNKDNDSD